MTNEKIAEELVRNHKDFETEGFSEYMNGYFNGIILGLEYAQGKVKNLSSNGVLVDSLPPSELIALKEYYDKKWKGTNGCRSQEQVDAEKISNYIKNRLADMAVNNLTLDK